MDLRSRLSPRIFSAVHQLIVIEFKSKNRSFITNRRLYCSNKTEENAMKSSPTNLKETAGYTSAEDRWKAVVRRDPDADGKFYYSVKTTGVYCRPCCVARLPRRENVEFYASCKDAERAGFRSCKRCRPKGLARCKVRAGPIESTCVMV
jgi:hypothetical protein